MADDDVRPEVVTALLRGQFVDATGVERALARREAETAARVWQHTSLLPRERSIHDIDLRALAALGHIVGQVWREIAASPPGRSLQDVEKVIDARRAENIRALLHWGGIESHPEARLRITHEDCEE